MWTASGAMRATGVCLVALGICTVARADAFHDYALSETFSLPAGASAMDVLSDGRVVTLAGDRVMVETSAGSRVFDELGTLAGADLPSFGAAFLRVSPDGSRIAVGNNGGASFGNYRVGVFSLSDLSGDWFAAGHFDAEWIDDRYLALSAGELGQAAKVTALDTTSASTLPDLRDLVTHIGGASAGVAFDAGGNLYTGNGFDGAGDSETGWIKAFGSDDWQAALSGGAAIDFEASGTLVAEVLSAGALGFDGEGNLHVGGGDFTDDFNYAGLVNHVALAGALSGGGAIDAGDAEELRMLDPDAANGFNFYDVNYNAALAELYVREGQTVYAYALPEPASLALMALGMGFLLLHRTRRRAGKVRLDACCVWAVAAVTFGVTSSTFAVSPFAAVVCDYSPAPGQFVNDALFSDPGRALGAPVGGGTLSPDLNSLVTLGGFGGYIVLGFDHRVLDDAANPFGVDAIVFSNAFWFGGDANGRWGEAGVIEISRDDNENGMPDDNWYLIPGSHIVDANSQFEAQTWDDNTSDPTFPPDDEDWLLPEWSGTWTTEGYRLPPAIFDVFLLENPNGSEAETEGIFGYANLSPTAVLGDLDGDNLVDDANATVEAFYVRPDNPFAVGLTAGSGGGDAIDIAWAIDPGSGVAADLDGFDFIRITNGVNFVAGPLGEVSPEIDAVADVAEGALGDSDGDGDFDGQDYAILHGCLGGPGVVAATSPCGVMDFDQDGDLDLRDYAALQMLFGA